MAKKKLVLPYPKFLTIDTETTGLQDKQGARPYLVTACDHEGTTYAWRGVVNPFTREVKWSQKTIQEIIKVIESYKVYVFHNVQFDIKMLKAIGIDLTDYWDRIHDTLLMAHVLDSAGRHGLKFLAKEQLDYPDTDEKVLQAAVVVAHRHAKKQGWKTQNVKADYWMPYLISGDESDKVYAVNDVERTALLFMRMQRALLEEGTLEVYLKHRRLFPCIHQMQENGISIRPRKLISEMKRYERDGLRNLKTCEQLLPQKLRKGPDGEDVNLASPEQLGHILFEHFKLPVLKRSEKTGNPSTDAGVLHDLIRQLHKNLEDKRFKHPKEMLTAIKFLEHLILARKQATAHSYLTSYFLSQVDGKLYPTFNQTGTKWTRFSSQNPNAQNVGKGSEVEIDGAEVVDFKLRDVFGPAKGKVWYAIDVDQLQLRIFARASGEKRMMQAFRDGFDFHTWMGMQVYRLKEAKLLNKLQRRVAKAINFGYIFGASPAKIDETSGQEGLSNELNEMFPEAHAFAKRVKHEVITNRVVRTLGGYPLTPDMFKSNWRTSGVCSIVQGTEGEIIKEAMVRIYELLVLSGLENSFIMQVHDEFIFEFDRDFDAAPLLRQIGEIMIQAAGELGVEIKVKYEKITTSWANGKEVSI